MSLWLQRSSLPYYNCSTPSRISNDEFMMVLASDGVHKYTVSNNKWTQIMEFDQDFESKDHEICYDKQNDLIYLANDDGKLLEIDINNKSVNTLSNGNEFTFYPMITHFNDTIHIFDVSKHFIFNKNTKTMEIKRIFDEQSGIDFSGCNILKMKSRKSILLFHTNLLSFCEYSLLNNKWNKWEMETQPSDLRFTAVVKSTNERFIIFLGGNDESHNRTDKISIYDLKTNSLSVSSIKCPSKECFYKAILMRNESNDELLTFGYVRQCFKMDIFKNVQVLPHYLIQLIGQWICNEYIHLFRWDSDRRGENHWRISLDSILQPTNS